ncbi:MAG: class I SAM-dependent methyltransferase [Candidatus Omnitrophica bacterium]|nr:class I SAM-dependent methyltransferase [Candidatus Omnitrophota bacterium]
MDMNLSYYHGRSANDLFYSRYESMRFQQYDSFFGREILDVGAGDSFHLDLLTHKGDRKGFAMDLNAQARAELEKKGYTVYANLDETDRQFDTVFFTHVIEHVSPGQIYDFFNRIVSLIRPGGNCFIISPVSKWFWDTPDHYRIYDKPAIRTLFRDTGLVEELCEYQGSQNVAARVLRLTGLRETVFRSDSLLPLYFRLSNFSKRDLVMVGRKPLGQG